LFFSGQDLVQTWTRPGLDLLDPVHLRPGPGPDFSGPDLEVQVRGPEILPGPDPDQTVDSVVPLSCVSCKGGDVSVVMLSVADIPLCLAFRAREGVCQCVSIV